MVFQSRQQHILLTIKNDSYEEDFTNSPRPSDGSSAAGSVGVKEKNLDTNEVILCDNNELFSKELYATDINLITCDKIDKPIKVKARVRYSQPEKDAIVEQIDDNTLHIVFDEPQRAI